jgi:hypothetical protein
MLSLGCGAKNKPVMAATHKKSTRQKNAASRGAGYNKKRHDERRYRFIINVNRPGKAAGLFV